MRILVVEQIFYPVDFQVNDVCLQLANDGHEVTVLTGLPNYPAGVIPKEYRYGKKRTVIWHGIKIIRCFEIPRKKGVAGMIANYFSFCISAALKALLMKEKFDVVLAYETSPVLMAYPGEVYAKKNKIPLLLYCCDIWPEVVKTMVSDEESIIFKVAKRISTSIYKRADLLAVQSKGFYDYFREVHNYDVDKLRYLPQYADSSYLDQDLSADENGVIDFVFLGNIGIAQDIGSLINAVEKIKGISGFHVHLVGTGSYYETAVRLVKEKQLENLITFYGRQPYAKMPVFYKLADVCLATLQADSVISLTIPSKVQGYMAAGKPIIAALSGFARDVIEESGSGIAVAPGNTDELAEAMKKFILYPQKYKNCGNSARTYYRKHFTKEKYMKSLYMYLDEVMQLKK